MPGNTMQIKTIGDFKEDRAKWVTIVEGEFYPDLLSTATVLYWPVLERFGKLLKSSQTSQDLLRAISNEPPSVRVQLQRVFRRYVSPDTSVEMLKIKRDTEKIIRDFGDRFRAIEEVRKWFFSRPAEDETLAGLLYEYKTRGQKGYDLTEAFFDWFEAKFGEEFTIQGPKRAGPDIPLKDVFPDYPYETTADFVIRDKAKRPLILGYGRYDSDRGGAQGLDRISSYSDKVTEILRYAKDKNLPLKILFVNDGPGLLLGLLWERYAGLEEKGEGKVIVATLKMLDLRVTREWISS